MFEAFLLATGDFWSAVLAFLGTIALGGSAMLIPWGLRLPKEKRHPIKTRPWVNNMLDQSTSSRNEWWGEKLRNCGWILFGFSFLIQIYVEGLRISLLP
jgi:hypothetical protein